MILYVKGNIFQSPAQVLVNTVNTVGVMGKGLALDFRNLFPEMFSEYKRLCDEHKLQVGTLWLYKTPNKWVLNFPTKQHWREPARIEHIEAGLKKFIYSYARMGIHSIAFPALGCGNGQLDFTTQVQPLMERYLKKAPIDVFIYPERAIGGEHITQKQLALWLRTEPTPMSFREVWHDLEHLLGKQSTFTYASKRGEFAAYMLDQPQGIQVRAGKSGVTLYYDELQMFWQQLRLHGFTMQQFASGKSRNLEYLLALFASLEYVERAQIADEFALLPAKKTTGLQILPSAFAYPARATAPLEQQALL